MRFLPVGVAVASGVAAAVIAAMVLAIVDLYITGHGGQSLARPWIGWGEVVAMSRADVILWLCALVAAVVAWFATRDMPKTG